MRYLLLLFMISQLSVMPMSAQEDILKRKVTIDFKNGFLEELLFQVAEQANFNLAYNASLIRNDSLLSYSCAQQSVDQVLRTILPAGLDTKSTGQHLIILKKTKPATNQKKEKYLVEGTVKSPISQSGLPQVLVFDMVGLVSTITDDQGKFSMYVPQQYDVLALSFSKSGYSNEVVLLPPSNHRISQELFLFDASFRSKTLDLKPTAPAPIETVGFVKQVVKEELITRNDNFTGSIRRHAQLSLWPGISTNQLMGSVVQNNLSINVFGGYAQQLSGVELGGLFNINRMQVTGYQAAGMANFTGGLVRGVQMAGLANHTKGDQSGVQIAGVYNTMMGSFGGLQLSGVSNVIGNDLNGWQIAGVNNVVVGTMRGSQLSGILNTTRGEVKFVQLTGVANMAEEVSGLQASGVINYAKRSLKGTQLAGVANIAQHSSGVQVAGAVNVALDSAGFQLGVINFTKKLKSAQIGVINYADSASGVPFGLISIVRKGGYIAPSLSVSELMYGNLSLNVGVRKLYNIFSVGIGQHQEKPFLAIGYGLGSQPRIGAKTFFITELSSHWLRRQGQPLEEVNLLQRLMLGVGYGKAKGVKVSVGPTLNALMSVYPQNTTTLENSMAPYTIKETHLGKNLVQLWMGGVIAIHF